MLFAINWEMETHTQIIGSKCSKTTNIFCGEEKKIAVLSSLSAQSQSFFFAPLQPARTWYDLKVTHDMND